MIGGAPAAAVVFAAEVSKRTAADPRVADLQAAIAEATASGAHDEVPALRARLASARPAVHAEKLGQLADEFDSVHSIERAREVGSVMSSSRPPGCARTSSTRSSAGWPGRSPDAAPPRAAGVSQPLPRARQDVAGLTAL